MGEKGKEQLKPPSLEEEVQEIKRKLGSLLELCIPPKEVLDEIKRDFITAQVSMLKIFKTLLDYEIEVLERLAKGGKPPVREKEEKPKKGVKKIKVE